MAAAKGSGPWQRYQAGLSLAVAEAASTVAFLSFACAVRTSNTDQLDQKAPFLPYNFSSKAMCLSLFHGFSTLLLLPLLPNFSLFQRQRTGRR